jgi:hypothetical protein
VCLSGNACLTDDWHEFEAGGEGYATLDDERPTMALHRTAANPSASPRSYDAQARRNNSAFGCSMSPSGGYANVGSLVSLSVAECHVVRLPVPRKSAGR